MIHDTLQFAAQNTAQGNAVALVTVTQTSGSSPASPGQMIAVLADGTSCGTVGGGASEHRVVLQAQAAIQNGQASFNFTFNHSDDDMVCGGSMAGFGTVVGAGPRLVIFGGGHIAQQLAPLASRTGFAVTVVEDRPELAEYFTGQQFVLATPKEYPHKVALTPGTYVVICTRGHKCDDDALQFCLPARPAYLGMIGSKNKVNTLFNGLRAQGMPEETLANIYAPIGLDIASSAPAEIAISIMSEILLVKNGGSPKHKKLLP
ncbi:XdhC family protein [Ruminococcaceae bacterium OttesenSCG-928-A16]|nr:XdhC family protein [Ruminococcaceae bacterium OttesenSCG-928-A16]